MSRIERNPFCDFPSQPDIIFDDQEPEDLQECGREIATSWILLLWMTFGLVQGTIIAVHIFGALMDADETE